MSTSKLRPFDEYYEEFSKTKKKNLQNFIDIARKIHRGEISFKQDKNIKKSNHNLIGVKRQRNDTTNTNNDIVGIIDDFIYTKRRIMNENEFEERVNVIKDKLNELIKEGIPILNNNAFNAIVRLMRFMSCSRNFSNDTIKQSQIIDEVKENMKSIIIRKLFDSTRIEEELTEYDTISSNELIAQIDSNEEECNSKESIKESQSVSESSMNLSSGSKTDYEDLKTKIKIFPVDGNGLYTILQSLCEINNKDIKDNEDTKTKLINLISLMNASTINTTSVQSVYLRKRVCFKLYSVFHVLFSNIDYVKDDDIKTICLAIEGKARIIDERMSQKYKNYISNIFKKIKAFFI